MYRTPEGTLVQGEELVMSNWTFYTYPSDLTTVKIKGVKVKKCKPRGRK